jgi:ribosomal-protein-alanine N-acetyltransferase
VEAVLVRDYRRADFESLWALDQQCFPAGIAYSRAELRAFLSLRTAETIVAERGGRIVAFVLGHRRSRTGGHVVTLDVAAPARRHGLGRRLLLELERRFRAAGARHVQLETAVANTVAIAFYEGLGYRKLARLAGYYGRGLHAWKMDKALDDGPPHRWGGHGTRVAAACAPARRQLPEMAREPPGTGDAPATSPARRHRARHDGAPSKDLERAGRRSR